MPFFDLAEQPSREIFPGVTVTTAWGDHVMLSYARFAHAGAVVPEHHHPHEQLGVGLEGEIELVIDGEARVLGKGDSYWIPGNVPHSARSIGGPALVLDIFHPVRDDYR